MLQTLERPETSSKATVTVAAIIPLYNGEAFIRESLESVLAQTEPADEIIVVDDGSTDGGAEIVKEMAARHPIRLISKSNGGIGSARNRGIAEAKSTHIALLDQDDIWYEDHLAVLKRPFLEGERRNLALVYANLDRIDRQGRNGIPQFSRSCSKQTSEGLPSAMRKSEHVYPARGISFQKRGIRTRWAV
jgi:glycosyltransferase involved in cell wall biosynthesis